MAAAAQQAAARVAGVQLRMTGCVVCQGHLSVRRGSPWGVCCQHSSPCSLWQLQATSAVCRRSCMVQVPPLKTPVSCMFCRVCVV